MHPTHSSPSSTRLDDADASPMQDIVEAQFVTNVKYSINVSSCTPTREISALLKAFRRLSAVYKPEWLIVNTTLDRIQK